MKLILAGVLLAVLAVLAVLVAPAGASTSGLSGRVSKSPARPVCRAELPCSAPARGMKLIFARAGFSRAAVTDSAGDYRIALSAGRYTVAIAGARFGYAPRTVIVIAGRVTVRNFSIDTGIR
ncbi:MAG: carboxypeptidase regulatory-like domain-containing protein [Actinobacteria bacterium]|nr:carboxypeptidase regulatory-like domain-containing protein [Actinomycetota bacterium]